MIDCADAAFKSACRICLTSKKALCPLFRYKLSGNYAEMLTAIADVKVGIKILSIIGTYMVPNLDSPRLFPQTIIALIS